MTSPGSKRAAEIRNRCRKNLLPFFRQALAELPPLKHPRILDAGCGSGFISMDIAMSRRCHITALDLDADELALFQRNLSLIKPAGDIDILHGSLFDSFIDERTFDWIIAEGLLNMTGFEKGFSRLAALSRPGSHMIIHDEIEKREDKLTFARRLGWSLLDSFYLDDEVWGEKYYLCLETALDEVVGGEGNNHLLIEQFAELREEIDSFKKNRPRYQSVYYIFRNVH